MFIFTQIKKILKIFLELNVEKYLPHDKVTPQNTLCENFKFIEGMICPTGHNNPSFDLNGLKLLLRV